MVENVDVIPNQGFYVTIRNGKRMGWLLGPYSTHDEALANVERGKELAIAADPFAVFYWFGTARFIRRAKMPSGVFGI